MSSQEFVSQQLGEAIQLKQSLLTNQSFMSSVCSAAEACLYAYRQHKKLLIAGNGGSAADAQHLAAEMVSRFYFDREPLEAFALTTDTSILTAVGNDYGFDRVFSRQIKASGKRGDVFLALSTSGKSPNILEALVQAKQQGMVTIGLTGADGGDMPNLCDFIIKVPSRTTARIQEVHIVVGHIMCSYIEQEIFAEEREFHRSRASEIVKAHEHDL